MGIVGGLLFVGGIAALFVFGAILPTCACPGEFPVGATLSVSTGLAECPAGNGSSSMSCAYTFGVSVHVPAGGGPTLTAPDLAFQLWSANDSPRNEPLVVRLVSPGGCALGEWDQSGRAWVAANGSSNCGAPYAHSIPLVSGQLLLLQAGPGGGLPHATVGDQLIAEGIGGGFAGTVSATID